MKTLVFWLMVMIGNAILIFTNDIAKSIMTH